MPREVSKIMRLKTGEATTCVSQVRRAVALAGGDTLEDHGRGRGLWEAGNIRVLDPLGSGVVVCDNPSGCTDDVCIPLRSKWIFFFKKRTN